MGKEDRRLNSVFVLDQDILPGLFWNGVTKQRGELQKLRQIGAHLPSE